MSLKLSVGLTKKVGQPNYGSLGASCHVEVELDQQLIVADLDGFHKRVRQAFVACRQAVQDELTQHRARGEPDPAGSGDSNGHDANGQGSSLRASDKQVAYMNRLAGEIRGLGVRRLETLAGTMFGKPLADLSSLDASGLIDVLKDIKTGSIRLVDALQGEAA